MDVHDRYERCVNATKGVMGREEAEMLCHQAVNVSRGRSQRRNQRSQKSQRIQRSQRRRSNRTTRVNHRNKN